VQPSRKGNTINYELVKLPLAELKARGTAREALAKAMQHLIDQIADRFGNLSLSGRPVKVHDWPTNEVTEELESALKKFDSGHYLDITSWNDVEK